MFQNFRISSSASLLPVRMGKFVPFLELELEGVVDRGEGEGEGEDTLRGEARGEGEGAIREESCSRREIEGGGVGVG